MEPSSALKYCKGEVTLDVFGTIYNETYWEKCKTLIKILPENITVNYKAALSSDQVMATLSHDHFLLLPSKGENFGHSIFEALHVGTPVLISDKTPWRDLASVQAGWDLDLSSPDLIAAQIQAIAAMSADEYMPWRAGARALADDFIQKTDFKSQYQRLFDLGS